MSAKKIALCNFKGGVGKTVLSVNIAAGLAQRTNRRGEPYKVLLIDADAQANSSVYMLGDTYWEREIYPNPQKSLYGFFRKAMDGDINQIKVNDLIGGGKDSPMFKSGADWENLYLLPSHYELARAEEILNKDQKLMIAGHKKGMKSFQLMDMLSEELNGFFDYIIIDCPPNIYNVSENMLYYADKIIVPVVPDWLSVSGLAWLILAMGENLKRFEQRQKKIKAIVPTMWQNIAIYNKQKDLIAEKLNREWNRNPNLKPLINGVEFWKKGFTRATDVVKVVEKCKPLTVYKKTNPSRDQIEDMVDKILAWK